MIGSYFCRVVFHPLSLAISCASLDGEYVIVSHSGYIMVDIQSDPFHHSRDLLSASAIRKFISSGVCIGITIGLYCIRIVIYPVSVGMAFHCALLCFVVPCDWVILKSTCGLSLFCNCYGVHP